MLTKLNELHQISLGSIAIFVSHLAVIVIQLVHRTPVLSVADSDDDHTQGQPAASHQKVLHLLFIMDDSVSQDQQDHILLYRCAHALADLHGFAKERREEGRATEGQTRKSNAIGLQNAVQLEEIGIGVGSVDGETVMDFVVGVESRHVDFCAETECRHQFIVIVIQDYIADFVEGFLIATSRYGSEVMKRVWVTLDAITSSEIDSQDHGHLQSIRQVISEVVFDRLFEVLQHDQPLLMIIFSQSHTVAALTE